MNESEPPWWILDGVWLVGATLIPLGVSGIILRERSIHPRTARLLLIAAGLCLIPVLTGLVRQFDPFAFGKKIYLGDGSLDFTSPATWQMLIMQWIYITGQIASWSLITWAILKRPEHASPVLT